MKIIWLTTSSINTEPVIGSLECIREPDWEIEIVRYDAYGEGKTDEVMIQKTLEYSPDVILYISTAGGPYLPAIDTFKRLRDIATIVHICCDASCPDWHLLLKQYKANECFDLTMNIDGCDIWPHDDKDLTLLCPIDTRPFLKSPINFDNFASRSIHCGFSGGIGSPHRRDTVGYLIANSALKINQIREESLGTYQKYADFMAQCKIALNMSLSGSERSKQVKGRVIETALAGACLLEDKGSATSDWFIPGTDYIEYENNEHALEIINGLYDNDSTIFRYAENLHRKVMTEHSPKIFWTKIFSILHI